MLMLCVIIEPFSLHINEMESSSFTVRCLTFKLALCTKLNSGEMKP